MRIQSIPGRIIRLPRAPL